MTLVGAGPGDPELLTIKAVRLIRREPDETIQRIVAGWATNFEARRARELGFTAETDFDAIIRAHIDDELGGRIAA